MNISHLLASALVLSTSLYAGSALAASALALAAFAAFAAFSTFLSFEPPGSTLGRSGLTSFGTTVWPPVTSPARAPSSGAERTKQRP